MMNKKKIGLTNILVLILGIVFTAIAAVMLFVGQFELVYLIYGISAAAIIYGIVMIIRYFTTDAFKNSNEYGFSVGTLIVIIGVCALIKAKEIASASVIILGLFLLLAGVVVLQYSMDLHRIKAFISSIVLLVSVLIIACSVMVILQPLKDKIQYDTVSWWMVLVSGALSLIIDIYTMIRIKIFKKKMQKEADDNAKDKPEGEPAADTAEKTEPETPAAESGTDKDQAADAQEEIPGAAVTADDAAQVSDSSEV